MPITCSRCGRSFKGDKLNARHLAKCFPELTPKVPPCLCGHEATSLTQMKRHRRTCAVWKERDRKQVAAERKKETSLERYGVEDGSQAPAVVARRRATNLERYGAENPFAKGASTFEKVQASVEGKRHVSRGVDNPFAKPEVQEKIRATMRERHGVDNPQQVPEIRARTRETNLERYGGELLGSPELAAKARATNEARYGDAFPQRTEEVQEKAQETNLARYGVPWTAMDPGVRQKQLETMEARWGSHYFASEEGKAEIRATMLERYGVEFPGAIEGHWEKAIATFRRRYGVDHPLRDPDILARRERTNVERYGWANFIGTPEFVLACLHSYGVAVPDPLPDHPMKVVEFAHKHLSRMRPKRGTNKLEQSVWNMAPGLLFTGDGAFWRRLPLLAKFKNPDFIVPGPDPEHLFKDVRQVVEVFGDYWHGRMKTGKAGFEHEQELIEAFAEIGITCLVIWESQVKADPEEVRVRLAEFVGG